MVQAKETAVGKLLEELISITREGKGNEWYKTMRSKWASSGAPQICVCNWCSQVKIFSRLDSFQFVLRPQPLIVNIWQILTNSDIQGKTFASLPQTTPSSWAQLRALDQPPGSELTGSNRKSKSENNNNLNKVNIPLNGENLVVFDGFRMATTMSISDVHSVLLVDCIVQVLQVQRQGALQYLRNCRKWTHMEYIFVSTNTICKIK